MDLAADGAEVGRGYGGWGGGYGGWGGGGWASPYYGNWYRGGWGNSASFWTGFGVGALRRSGWGACMAEAYGGWYGYSYPGFGAMPVAYSYFPTWGMSTYSGWGLGSLANSWLYSGYTNPYYATVVAAQPAQTTVVYDYSQPINVTAAPPDASVTESTEQVFSAARDAFMAGDYQRALELSDQVLKQTPNAAVVHEFRGLCLFALQRYDDAAAVDYAVLTAGPGWNWSTMVGLYPGVDAYTNQLRALEAFARANPNSTSARFLLGYHYMVQGNQEAAAEQFENVVKLQPNETLSASFAKALRKANEPAPAATTAAAPRRSSRSPELSLRQPRIIRRRRRRPRPAGAEPPPAEAPEQAGSASPARADGWHVEGAAGTRCFDHLDPASGRPVRLGRRQQGPETIAHRQRRIQRQRAGSVPEGRASLDRQGHSERCEQVRLRSDGRGRQGPGLDVYKVTLEREIAFQ